MGRHVAQEPAHQDLPFVVIDPSPEKVSQVSQSGFPALQGISFKARNQPIPRGETSAVVSFPARRAANPAPAFS